MTQRASENKVKGYRNRRIRTLPLTGFYPSKRVYLVSPKYKGKPIKKRNYNYLSRLRSLVE